MSRHEPLTPPCDGALVSGEEDQPGGTALSPAVLTDRDREDGIEQRLITAIVTNSRGQVLLVRRAVDDYLGGVWEVPSGAIHPGETMLQALYRAIHEKTGFNVQYVTGYLGAVDSISESGTWSRQHTLSVAVYPGVVRLNPAEHDAHRWVRAGGSWPVSETLRAQLRRHFQLAQARSS